MEFSFPRRCRIFPICPAGASTWARGSGRRGLYTSPMQRSSTRLPDHLLSPCHLAPPTPACPGCPTPTPTPDKAHVEQLTVDRLAHLHGRVCPGVLPRRQHPPPHLPPAHPAVTARAGRHQELGAAAEHATHPTKGHSYGVCCCIKHSLMPSMDPLITTPRPTPTQPHKHPPPPAPPAACCAAHAATVLHPRSHAEQPEWQHAGPQVIAGPAQQVAGRQQPAVAPALPRQELLFGLRPQAGERGRVLGRARRRAGRPAQR